MAIRPSISVRPVAPQARSIRRPQHTWQLSQRPWTIQPFLIAPVLPGETLRNLIHQSRVVTDPVVSKLTGWWCEYYYFYVKHRDLHEVESIGDLTTGQGGSVITHARWDAIQKMHLDPEYDLRTELNVTTDDPEFYADHQTGGGVNWTKLCLARIVSEYFRDEDEDLASQGAFSGSNLWQAKAVPNRSNAIDSLMQGAAVAAEDVELEVPVNATPDPDVAELSMSAFDQAWRTYQWLQQSNLVQMSFEDYLATHGVQVPRPETAALPELIRYDRSWQYPSNTVDPADGSVASAVSWSPAFRADKDRFFAEPGFIMGVCVVRPKVYLTGQRSAMAHHLTKAIDWLPAVLAGDPRASLRFYADNVGPFPSFSDTSGYWVDLKDLFLYGDQFFNVDSASVVNPLALPAADGKKRYATLDEAKALFVDSTNDVLTRIRQDGVATLMIASRVGVDQYGSTR